MATVRQLAPAKLNLFLHILGRRPDGYHSLQTVFQFLDYGDDLEFSLREDGKINLISSVNITNNLILKAAHLLQELAPTRLGIDIKLIKRIPLGGGLGGGSSDAATVLVTLNHLWQLNLPRSELLNLGLQLGADVPVFIQGQAAWAEGIGEKLSPLDLNEPWYLILSPPCSIPTAEIFSTPELTRNTRPITIGNFLEDNVLTRNDFEPIVRRDYPMVAQGLDWLNQFGEGKLSGSGSSVFLALPSELEAKRIAEQTPKLFKAIIAKGLNTSPLFKMCCYTR